MVILGILRNQQTKWLSFWSLNWVFILLSLFGSQLSVTLWSPKVGRAGNFLASRHNNGNQAGGRVLLTPFLSLSNEPGSVPHLPRSSAATFCFWPGAWQAHNSSPTYNFLFLITFWSSEMFALILSQLCHFRFLFYFPSLPCGGWCWNKTFGAILTRTLLCLLSEPECPVRCQIQNNSR